MPEGFRHDGNELVSGDSPLCNVTTLTLFVTEHYSGSAIRFALVTHCPPALPAARGWEKSGTTKGKKGDIMVS